MIYTLAITGSIASGKTRVATYLNEHDVTIIDADNITHNILKDDISTIKLISSHFGHAILSKTGSIDRKKLRKIIFKNNDEKVWLENILHPLIRKKIREKQEVAHGDFCVLLIPLLNERNIKHYHIDLVCKVKTDKAIQIERVISRDDIKYEEAKKIIEDQELNNNLKIDYIINNDGSIEQLKQETKKLQEVIMQMKSKDK